jgi:hypothetical protein
LMWSAMVAEQRISEKGGLPEDSEARVEKLERDAELAHLAGKLDCARHFIASVLPVNEGQLAGLAWGDSSSLDIANASF